MSLRLEVGNRFLILNRSESLLNERTVDFGSIVKTDAYSSGRSVVTFADLDGVFLEYGKNDCVEKNIERFRALTKIAKVSEEIVLWSGRTESDMFAFMPFIERSKIIKIKKLINIANPNCQVSFDFGIQKLLSASKMRERVEKIISQDKNVVVIGSSFFDRKSVAKIADNIGEKRKNLFYFDTGHWIV